MADLKTLEERLKEIGCNFRFWGRAELRELANVLMPNEIVEHCVNGQYQAGFAMLVATDQRVLLIDKKPMYLSLEDIRYDMMSEVDFNHRLLDASIFICTPTKSLRFVAYNQARLRKLFHFVQMRVMEIRQHYQQLAAQQAQQMQQLQQLSQIPQPMAAVVQQTFSTDQPAPAIGSEPMPQIAAAPTQAQPVPQPTALPMMPPHAAPIISAYTRLPTLARQRRFLGSRAIHHGPLSSIYSGQQPVG